MRIGLDARISRNWETGVGRLTLEVLEHWVRRHPEHRYVLLRHPDAPRPDLAGTPELADEVVACPVASVRQAYLFTSLPRRLGLDVLLHTHPLAAPVLTSCPSVGIVLDVFPLIFPDQYSRQVSLYYRTVGSLAQRTKRRVIAISEASRQDAIRYLGVRPDRIQVVHLAAAPHFQRLADREALSSRLADLGLNRPYVAYVGNTRPHKNLPRLFAAFAAAVAGAGLPHDLVIAGLDDSREADVHLEELRRLAADLGITDRVRFLGKLSDDQLVDLYNGACVFAIPSLYEGFGVPALEAMACGTPVLAGRAGSLPEIVGQAAYLVDPTETASIAAGLSELLRDTGLRDRLVARGYERTREFSWERAAERILEICVEAAC
jgi:glycosyltransferase involved in cell wall biosynthesis